jgi:hypothetical protein
MGNPTAAIQYYQYLTATWKDSTPMTYGGTGHLSGGVDCNYAFPDASDPIGFGTNMQLQVSWDEVTSKNVAGDRRGLGSFGPFTFVPGGVEEVEFAYVFGRSTPGTPNANLASVTVMKDRIDSVRTKFNKGITTCGCNGTTTGINNLINDKLFTIYPNPATNIITIDYRSSSKNYSIKIYDATGQLVKNLENISSTKTTLNIVDLNSGIYLLNISDGSNSITHRFVKE